MAPLTAPGAGRWALERIAKGGDNREDFGDVRTFSVPRRAVGEMGGV